MQRSTPTRPVRRLGTSDSRRRAPGVNGTAQRREGSSRRDTTGGPASPRRRTRRDAATITIESDTDTSVEEIEPPLSRTVTLQKRRAVNARQHGVVAGLLWPLRMLLSLIVSTVHILVSPLLLQLLPYVLGVLLVLAVARFGYALILQIAMSAIQAPFRLAWNLFSGEWRLSDMNIGRTLSIISNTLPSGTTVMQGVCHVAPIPGLCAVGTYEKMKAMQERDRAIVARKLQKEGMCAGFLQFPQS